MHAHLPSLTEILEFVSQSLAAGYTSAVVGPLRRLYRTGPTLGGLGFWRNASDADICAALTNVDAQFWHVHKERCARTIEEDFQSYLVVFETAVYFLVLYQALRALWLVVCTISHKTLQRHGIVERYSPRTLAWLQTRFPSMQSDYQSANVGGQDLRNAEDGHTNKSDSPYSVYKRND